MGWERRVSTGLRSTILETPGRPLVVAVICKFRAGGERGRGREYNEDSRSVQSVDISDLFLQVLPNLRELSTARSHHGQVSDLAPSTKVKHGKTNNTDFLIGLRATRPGPSGGVLIGERGSDGQLNSVGLRGALEAEKTYLSGTTHQNFKQFRGHVCDD
jgi:hypothetical protein